FRETNSGIGKISGEVSRRYTGRRFEFFERTRDVEFDRKWNITRTGQSREVINQAEVSVQPTELTSLSAEIGQVDRDRFSGVRQASSFNSEEDWLQMSYAQDWVRSEDALLEQDGSWFRHQGRISKSLGEDIQVTPYIRFDQENREQKQFETDSLLAVSEKFYDVGPGLRLNFSSL
ncbi:MAG TPA: hypothetical protein DD671_15710, partial [Balneolaceae bacterium]|nr:hypothetical protein [Balneolaceae bacterium]